MLRKIVFLFAILLSSMGFAIEKSPIGIFTPPKGWYLADPTSLSSHVLVGYVGNEKKIYRPSINLATEETNVSLKEYIQAVKKIHSEDKNTKIRELGTIKTKAGDAALLEILSYSNFGNMRMLQAILIKDNQAYILTGASLKDEFFSYSKELSSSIRSLEIIDNIYDIIGSNEKKELLQNKMLTTKEEIQKNNLLENEKKTYQKIRGI